MPTIPRSWPRGDRSSALEGEIRAREPQCGNRRESFLIRTNRRIRVLFHDSCSGSVTFYGRLKALEAYTVYRWKIGFPDKEQSDPVSNLMARQNRLLGLRYFYYLTWPDFTFNAYIRTSRPAASTEDNWKLGYEETKEIPTSLGRSIILKRVCKVSNERHPRWSSPD